MRKRMTLFRIIGSRSIWSYLSLQITCETFWLENSMERWKLPLMSPVKTLGRLMWREGYLRESLSPLLFALSMVPLSLILRMVNASYEWGKEEYKLNHFLFIGDLKLLFKSEEQMYTLLRTVHVFSTDVGFEFEIKWRMK